MRKKNALYRLFFNKSDERAYGRFAFFFDNLMQSFSDLFAKGAFYTAFLRLNNVSMSDVGVMTYLPIIANAACVFSPFIFAKVKRRKPILMAARMAYYFTNLCGVALVPMLVTAPGARMWLMATMLSLANVIWGLFVGGFTDWELNYLPMDGTREEYFAYRNLINAILGVGTNLLAGVVSSAIELRPEPEQVLWLFWLRMSGFIFILLDVLVFVRAKEYPYEKSVETPRMKDVFRLPLQNMPFRTALLVRNFRRLAIALTSSSWLYYLLDCGLRYSTQSFLAAIPPILTLLLTKPAVALFRKMGCVKNFYLFVVIGLVVNLAYVFVNPSTVSWLYPMAYVIVQIATVGESIADMDFIYRFMPKKDRLTYYSFYYLSSAVMVFIGAFLGAQYITYTDGKRFSLFGAVLSNVQLLVLIQSALLFFVVLYFSAVKNKLAAIRVEEVQA